MTDKMVFFHDCSYEYGRFFHALPEDVENKTDLFYTYLGEMPIRYGGDLTQPSPMAHTPPHFERPSTNWPIYFSISIKGYNRLLPLRNENATFTVRVWYLRHINNAKNQPTDN